jgi:hypothetical protein
MDAVANFVGLRGADKTMARKPPMNESRPIDNVEAATPSEPATCAQSMIPSLRAAAAATEMARRVSRESILEMGNAELFRSFQPVRFSSFEHDRCRLRAVPWLRLDRLELRRTVGRVIPGHDDVLARNTG